MRGLHNLVLILSIIGAINWGLIGLFNFNLVGAVFGTGAMARIIYSLVGIAGVVLAYTGFKAQQTGERLGHGQMTQQPRAA